MLMLGQRNDDSLAREFDWFGSSERLEISPASIWVPDEDETIRRRRVPAPNPSSIEEDSGDEWSLHEISPQVSVRDEDSFAKPCALPEITPHVSVRDEDSFAKPRALPEINPHVSIRDEDSFAKPCALPEISPQLSIIEESYDTNDSLPQFTSGICGVDESKVQPGEPSFMTVALDGQNEKSFVQEYIELGPSRASEVVSSLPIVLESSRAVEVEPSRASEVVSSLPIKSESSTPPRRPIVVPLVRVLDESHVLPGEASFATAIPSGPSAPRVHSPLEEFLAKINLDLRTFGLATLLFISIIGVSALVILEATTGFFSSQHVANATANQASQTAESAVPQSVPLPAAKPLAPLAASKLSKQEIQSMAPPHGYSKFPGEATKPMPLEGSKSDLSPKAHSSNQPNDVRAEKADKKSAGKSAARETSAREGDKHSASAKILRANVKESGAKKKATESVARHSISQRKLEVKKSTSKDTARKSVSASAKNATVTKPKTEVKVPSASNGAQRPRTVNPRKTS